MHCNIGTRNHIMRLNGIKHSLIIYQNYHKTYTTNMICNDNLHEI